jgi:enoyl-CoA hydratase
MPEVGIGFFPDVGATYALPRLPGATGAWLAITGSRIRRADALHLGLATHAVRASSEAGLLDRLAAGAAPDAAAAEFAESPGEAPIAANRAAIDRHFAQPTLAAIIASLERAAAAGEDFAIETLKTLVSKSPMSMAIALEQVRRGASLTFEGAMALEFRVVNRLIHDPDFAEGVRALIIDKDNRPNWQPATIGLIDPERLAEHFAPLEAELDPAMSAGP